MKRYRIVRHEEYLKNGDLKTSLFNVEKSYRIWKWDIWVYVRVPRSTVLEPLPKKVSFTFITEAQDFIENVLLPGNPYSTSVKNVVQVY